VPLISEEYMSGQSFNRPLEVQAAKIDKEDDPGNPQIRKRLGSKKISKSIN
jgi:hypothetical protein